jgi:hypothetical protein
MRSLIPLRSTFFISITRGLVVGDIAIKEIHYYNKVGKGRDPSRVQRLLLYNNTQTTLDAVRETLS